MSTDQRQIARAAMIVMGAFVLSRVLGLAREIIISNYFGTSADLGAYLAAFRIPDIIFQVVAGGALASAFIPTFSTLLAHDDEVGGWKLVSAIVNWLLIVLTSLALLGILFAPQLVKYVVAPGFDAGQQRLTAELMRYMLVSTVIFGLSGVVMGILNSYQHFLLPALAPAIYNLAIIASALLFAQRFGVRSLAIGVIAGAILHLIIQMPKLLGVGLKYTPLYLGPHNSSVREVGWLMLPRALGLGVVQINFLVNTILASHLGANTLTALNYAWLLMLLPQGIFAQGIATAAFPTFSRLIAQRKHDDMRSTLSATIRAILYISIPASVGLVILRVPLIQLLFQRGAFDFQSTEAVAAALQFYALGLFAHASVEITTRAFYAMHDTATPVAIGVAAMGANIILSLLLVHPMNYPGLALANSLATIGEMLALIYIVRKRLGGLGGKAMWVSISRMLVAAACMAAIVWVLRDGLATYGIIIQLGGSIAVAAFTYVLISAALGSTEIRTLWGWTKQRAASSRNR